MDPPRRRRLSFLSCSHDAYTQSTGFTTHIEVALHSFYVPVLPPSDSRRECCVPSLVGRNVSVLHQWQATELIIRGSTSEAYAFPCPRSQNFSAYVPLYALHSLPFRSELANEEGDGR